MGDGRKDRRKQWMIRRDEAVAEVDKASTTLKDGLQVLTPEQADAIIGENQDRHKKLLEATQANFGMMYASMCQAGCPKSQKMAHLVAQALTMQLQMVHNAYALGISHGKEDQIDGTIQEGG